MRSTRTLVIFALIVALGILPASAQAGVPIQISHQGLLTDAGGVPVTGSHTLTFSILENPAGGAPLWTEVHPGVSIPKGLFTVALGSVTTLSSDVLAPAGSGGTLTTIERYLEVQVDGDPPMTPRTRLIAAPYAVAAGRVAGDVETGLGELTLKSVSGSHMDHSKASDASAGRTISIDGIDVHTEQADDDSSWATLSSQRFGRPAINTARTASNDLGARADLIADLDGDGVAESNIAQVTRSTGANMAIKTKGTGAQRYSLVAGTSPDSSGLESSYRESDIGGLTRKFNTISNASSCRAQCLADLDGDGVPENFVAQVSDAAGARLAIKTKGTGAQRYAASLGATTDSSIISNGSDEDADGRENVMFSSISNVLKCRASCIFDLDDDGRDDHAWSATVDAVRSRTILAADVDLDGTPDNVLTQTTDDIGASSTIQSRFGSGPRQTTSMDGTFSHASTRCATDVNADGNPEWSVENYSDVSRARTVVTKHLLEPHEVRLQVDDAGPSLSLTQTGALRLLASPDSGLHIYNAAAVRKWYADADGDMYAAGTLKVGTTSGAHQIDVVGGAYCDGTDWVNGSDVNSKENFAPVDGREILEKLNRLDITRWNYKGQDKANHIGPTAQEFHAAFGVGIDDKSISTIDPSGIALAAIKELNKQNQELRNQNQDLKNELDGLKKAVEKLQSRQ